MRAVVYTLYYITMKKISLVQAVILTSIIAIPLTTFAQTGAQVSDGIRSLRDLIDLLTNTIVKSLATLLLSLALLAFFYGIVEYIWGKRQGNGEKTKLGNEFMTWGLVALFVMFSVYGIIKLGQSILFNNADINTISIPNIQFKAGNASNVQIGNSSPGGTSGGVMQGSTAGGTNAVGNNPSAYTPISGGSNTGNGGAGTSVGGGDCTVNTECPSGFTCQNYTCQSSTNATPSGNCTVNGATCASGGRDSINGVCGYDSFGALECQFN